MNIATIIAVLALIIIVGLALRYIIKEKKKGSKCVGCPYAESCCRYASASGPDAAQGRATIPGPAATQNRCGTCSGSCR